MELTEEAGLRVAAAERSQMAAAAAARDDPLSVQPREFASKRSGVKGVQADRRWDAYQQQKQADIETLKALDALRGGVTLAVTPCDNLDTDKSKQKEGGEDEQTDDFDDGDDDCFLARYREARIREIKGSAAYTAMHARYGTLRELIDGGEFVSAVDGVPATTLAVVLLWEPYLPACRAIRAALESLAPSHP